MKKFLILAFPVACSCYGQRADFVKTNDGIIIHPDLIYPGSAAAVQLKVIGDNIIKVIAFADKNSQAAL